jgi:TolA-binding protein
VRLLAAIPFLLSALLLGQARTPSRSTRGRADGGGPVLLGTDPPGRLRPAAAPADGGTAQAADAGPDDVHRELQALRARVDALEQDRARSQETSQQLQEITGQLQQLRQQLADVEAQRQAGEEQQREQRSTVDSAVSSLYAAQQRLQGGNASIDAELEQAQAAFSGQARMDVQAARAALQNKDLTTARTLLSAAISDAQAGR